MQTIMIAAGEGTPEVVMDFKNATFSFKGESYPEDVGSFYGKILVSLENFVRASRGESVKIIMQLSYFNSASTRIFSNIFKTIASAIEENGVSSEVDWICHKEDEMSFEYAEEFKEDFETIKFNLISYG